MNDIEKNEIKNKKDGFDEKIKTKAARKIKKQKRSDKILLTGLSLMGLVGWSITIPTLLGIAVGVFLDKYFPSKYSCTIAFLMLGLIIGCFTAWRWISKEERDIKQKEEGNDE